MVEMNIPFNLTMDCFWSIITKVDVNLLDAQEAKWLRKNELYSVQWLPAGMGPICEIEEK